MQIDQLWLNMSLKIILYMWCLDAKYVRCLPSLFLSNLHAPNFTFIIESVVYAQMILTQSAIF